MKDIVIATLGEMRKNTLILWSYRANLLFSLISIIIAFIGVSFIIDVGKPNPEHMASTLLGFLLWYYVTLITENMGQNLVDEAQAGTLEQMFISPVPINFILIGRVLANLIISSVQMAVVGGVLIVVMRIPLDWHWSALPVLVIALGGLFGFGFMLAGLGLVFKQAHSMAATVNSVLLVLNGALVPLEQFPAWLLPIAQILPTTLAIAVLRRILLQGASLDQVWRDGSLPLLIMHSAIFLIGGWLVLRRCVIAAKKQGTLGQY